MNNWRYRFVEPWQLEQLTAHNPEDMMIKRIDNVIEKEINIPDDFWDVVEGVLKEKEYTVVYARLIDKKTYADIGTSMGLSRQRAHQIYSESIAALKPILKEWISLRPRCIELNMYLRSN